MMNIEKARKSQAMHGYFRIRDLLQDFYSNKEYRDAVLYAENSRNVVAVDLSNRGVFGYTYRWVNE